MIRLEVNDKLKHKILDYSKIIIKEDAVVQVSVNNI